MNDVIDLVQGYWTLKKLKRGGFLQDEKFNLSFSEFIVRAVRAIDNLEKKEVNNENKQS